MGWRVRPGGSSCKDNHYTGHEGAASDAGCLGEDFDERIASWAVQGSLDITQAEENRNQHGEAENSIEHHRTDHRPWDDGRRASNFFGHVSHAVGSHKSEHDRIQSDEESEAFGAPAAIVSKCREHIGCRSMWSEVNQRNENGKEPEYVENEEQSFEFGQVSA